MARALLSTFLKDEATLTESNHIGDYSLTPRYIVHTPPAGHVSLVMKMSIVIEDAGTLDSGQYGNKVALENGVEIGIKNDDGIIGKFTNGLPIKTNGDYSRYAESVTEISFGSGNQFLKIFHEFSAPIILEAEEKNESLYILLNDDFTGIIKHTFYVTGITVTANAMNRRLIQEKYMHNISTPNI